MKRRRFLTDTAALAALALMFRNSGLLAQTTPVTAGAAPTPAPTPAADAVATQFVPLRRNVGIFNGRGGTIGWLASAEALAVVDTQFPATAALSGGAAGTGRAHDRCVDQHASPWGSCGR